MEDRDVSSFVDIFRQLRQIFPLRGEAAELDQMERSYFKLLRRFGLAQVMGGARRWMEVGKRFPKPAEWIESLPARISAEVPAMNEAEALVYRRAEALYWQDEPCACAECLEAGVDQKPVRFVPEARIVRDPAGNRLVTAGHWAHGWELFRCYEAQAEFWNHAYELGLMNPRAKTKHEKLPLAERLEALFSGALRRMPGGGPRMPQER